MIDRVRPCRQPRRALAVVRDGDEIVSAQALTARPRRQLPPPASLAPHGSHGAHPLRPDDLSGALGKEVAERAEAADADIPAGRALRAPTLAGPPLSQLNLSHRVPLCKNPRVNYSQIIRLISIYYEYEE